MTAGMGVEGVALLERVAIGLCRTDRCGGQDCSGLCGTGTVARF